jgi:hypothetical protein
MLRADDALVGTAPRKTLRLYLSDRPVLTSDLHDLALLWQNGHTVSPSISPQSREAT